MVIVIVKVRVTNDRYNMIIEVTVIVIVIVTVIIINILVVIVILVMINMIVMIIISGLWSRAAEVHRWNRNPRPQPRKFTKLVFLM